VSKGVYEQLLGKAELAGDRAMPALQPESGEPEDHPPYLLGKHDNLDKHRLVLVIEQAVRINAIEHCTAPSDGCYIQ
jgi:hypothetical protein